jgi:hypothetical protein
VSSSFSQGCLLVQGRSIGFARQIDTTFFFFLSKSKTDTVQLKQIDRPTAGLYVFFSVLLAHPLIRLSRARAIQVSPLCL